jgi:hypothetical protein
LIFYLYRFRPSMSNDKVTRRMRPINVSIDTLYKLNKIVGKIKWRLSLKANVLSIEQCKPTRAAYIMHCIMANDTAVKRCFNELRIDIPMITNSMLRIVLSNNANIFWLPKELDCYITLAVTGVSVCCSFGSNINCFMAVTVDCQKVIDFISLTMNIECFENSHFVVAANSQ